MKQQYARSIYACFCSDSLQMRLEAVAEFIKDDDGKRRLLQEAKHHISCAITYLNNARSQWSTNIYGGTVDEIDRVCVGAAHYCYSRLYPAFFALSMAHVDCLQEMKDYILIEEDYVKDIQMIRTHREKTDEKFLAGTDAEGSFLATEKVINRYRCALMMFANRLVLHLELTCICLYDDARN